MDFASIPEHVGILSGSDERLLTLFTAAVAHAGGRRDAWDQVDQAVHG